MLSRTLGAFTFVLCAGLAPPLAAAQSPPAAATPGQATAVALRLMTGEDITVDGVLAEAAWERAEPIGNFTQSEPRNGERETERTDIRILFSGDNLYRRGILPQLNYQFNRIELVEGNFSTRLLRSTINTQFSPFVSLSNNLQYDSVSRVPGWRSRFRWITKPGNDIYCVWLTNWIDAEERLATLDRNGAIKLLYTYRL